MIISAHQPAYNPWLGYFHKLLLSDVFVIMDDVQFEKNSFINRNKIFQKPEGLMLTIPCNMKNYADKSIKEIEISNDIWKKKHLRSLSQTYSKSPYFDKVFPIVEKALNLDSKLLIDYLNQLFLDIVSYLEIDTKIVFASDLDIKSKKLDYVIELTKKLNGKVFVFGQLGKDYADVKYLKDNNIIPLFQDYQHPEYEQKGGAFMPYLGVLDLLFFQDKLSVIKIILSGNLTKNEIDV
jgi:hypothetical protein